MGVPTWGLQAGGILLQITFLLYVLSLAGYLFFLIFQKARIQKISVCLISGGVLTHLAGTVLLGAAIGGLPVHNMVQSLSMAALAIGGMFLYVQYKFNLKMLGLFAAAMLSAVMLAVLLLPDTQTVPNDTLKGFWFYCHIILIFTGDAALALACGAGILYLLQEKGIKAKTPGFFFRRLPSLDFLDSVSHACITTGFFLLTLGLITGFVYAKVLWGRFWSWDFKEVFSMGAWLVYAVLLHLRLYGGWRGRKSAIMTIVGFCIIVFTFLGVNLFLGGHHQEFTK
ncbi:MAG TPA: cytochrome c biogenesis protein CcsA [Desulfotignum sp.]|jgi:cytochrome c-type biogenesis protein CcsB|nr:cytochrome c biogenesis protein CcsA [Desulfotignum sp.]